MESDWDMFGSEPQGGVNQENGGKTANSCPANIYIYGYIILFNWGEGLKKPFKIFPRKAFAKEIKDRVIEKELPDKFRVKKLKPFTSLPGQILSLFAKVEACKY